MSSRARFWLRAKEREAEAARACALYADVIEALEQHVCNVEVDNCGNELTIVVVLAEEHRIDIAGRHALPWGDDRSELGGWAATYTDEHGHSKLLYDTTTPEGEPPGDLSVEPLAEAVGGWATGWLAEHS